MKKNNSNYGVAFFMIVDRRLGVRWLLINYKEVFFLEKEKLLISRGYIKVIHRLEIFPASARTVPSSMCQVKKKSLATCSKK